LFLNKLSPSQNKQFLLANRLFSPRVKNAIFRHWKLKPKMEQNFSCQFKKRHFSTINETAKKTPNLFTAFQNSYSSVFLNYFNLGIIDNERQQKKYHFISWLPWQKLSAA
jgi:hypothetical protein